MRIRPRGAHFEQACNWTRSSARNEVYGVKMPYFTLKATSSSTSSLFWPWRSI